MSQHQTKYVVAMCGDLNRGERMNCAVFAWDTALGDDASVTLHMIRDWSRIESAFSFHESVRENIIERLSAIKTYADYRRMCDRMGPYTPFEFTEERGSIVSPNETASDMATYFLRQNY